MSLGGDSIAQLGMDERELGSLLDRSQPQLDARRAAALLGRAAQGPTPAHDDSLGFFDFEELPGALMLVAIDRAEPDLKESADADVGAGRDHRQVVRPPP